MTGLPQKRRTTRSLRGTRYRAALMVMMLGGAAFIPAQFRVSLSLRRGKQFGCREMVLQMRLGKRRCVAPIWTVEPVRYAGVIVRSAK